MALPDLADVESLSRAEIDLNPGPKGDESKIILPYTCEYYRSYPKALDGTFKDIRCWIRKRSKIQRHRKGRRKK